MCCTGAMCYTDTMCYWYYVLITLCVTDTMALWHYDTMALWPYGTMSYWHFVLHWRYVLHWHYVSLTLCVTGCILHYVLLDISGPPSQTCSWAHDAVNTL
jgi:hypothetical protein